MSRKGTEPPGWIEPLIFFGGMLFLILFFTLELTGELHS